MSAISSPYGESLDLVFKGHYVRALMINAVPYMALPDILDACGYNEKAAEYVNSPGFPAFGKHVVREEPDPEIPGEPQDVVMLSPTGIYYWATSLDPNRTSGIVAWSKRERKRLCPNPEPGDPAVHLMLVQKANGWTHVPPGPPSKYSGWKSDWEDLKWSDYSGWKDAESRNFEWRQMKRDEAHRHAA